MNQIIKLEAKYMGLTKRETEIYSALYKRKGGVVPAYMLMGGSSHNALKVHINHLRAKIAHAGLPIKIVTAWNIGYRLKGIDIEWATMPSLEVALEQFKN